MKVTSIKWMVVAIVSVTGWSGRAYATESGTTTKVDLVKTDDLYLVPEYDSRRDPSKDLADALKLAQKDDKNIILQVGGDWCSWCREMTDYFHTTQSVHDVLSKNYVIMKVTYCNENKNEAFLSAYPKPRAFPHLFVLDKSGSVLCSQYTGDLEEGGSYSEKAMLEFLNKWTPANAKPKTTDTGLSKNEKTED